MNIQHYQPKNKELQKHIESYYILEHSKNEDKISYLTFPSIFSFVAIIKNAECIITAEKIVTTFSQSKLMDTSLVCRFNAPICFEYCGKIKEICIYFKPLGLNAFLKKHLETYSQNNYDPFVPFSDYEKSMKKILDIQNKDKMVESLEMYWLGKMIGFEHPFLDKAIFKIQENPKITTMELAKLFNISQKTLIVHFKTHLCKTPSEYKKIIRFRKALAEMQKFNKKSTLTELSYIVEYFDQSHMISNFKSLTGQTPKRFFKNLATLENSNIHWIFN